MASTEIGTQFSLAIFFLYFVLLSGDCYTLLNCDLQRYFKNSVWIKHVIVFFTIFLFTFILDWYSYDSLVVGKESYANNDNVDAGNTPIRPPPDSSYVMKSIMQSIGIYILFLITCKSEGPAVGLFIIAMLVSINIIIYVKAVYPDLIHHLNEKPMTNMFTQKFANDVIELENIESHQHGRFRELCLVMNTYKGVLLGGIGIVCAGTVMYTSRQYRDHAKNWSTLKFVFGNGCK